MPQVLVLGLRLPEEQDRQWAGSEVQEAQGEVQEMQFDPDIVSPGLVQATQVVTLRYFGSDSLQLRQFESAPPLQVRQLV